MRKLLAIVVSMGMLAAPATALGRGNGNATPEEWCEKPTSTYPYTLEGRREVQDPIRNVVFRSEPGRGDVDYELLEAHWWGPVYKGSAPKKWDEAAPKGVSILLIPETAEGWRHFKHYRVTGTALEVPASLQVELEPAAYLMLITPLTEGILEEREHLNLGYFGEEGGCLAETVIGRGVVVH